MAGMSNGLPDYFMTVPFYHHNMEAEDGGGGDGAVGGVQPMMDPAAVASKNHRDAERRRRERIKSHLDRLRTILACDPKTDKASLLAKTVERVKDLKQQTEEIIAHTHDLFPTETDEIVVLPSSTSVGSQWFVFQTSLCCEDRSDLLPELIETLHSLRLKTLRAEIATLGGRVRNLLLLAKEKEEHDEDGVEYSDGAFLTDALKALVHRPLLAGNCKRRRLVDRSLV